MSRQKFKCIFFADAYKLCNKPCDDGIYCREHQNAIDDGEARPGYRTPQVTQHKPVDRKRLKAELERDLKQLKRDTKQGFKVSKSDFPCYISGIFFESIEAYADYYASTPSNLFDEMESVDNPYDLKTLDFRNITEWYPKGGFKGSYTSVKQYVAPPVNLQKNSWKRIEAIAHMRYNIARAADGLYYAVWVGLAEDAKPVEVMAELLKTELPIRVPQLVGGCNIHTSKGYETYRRAEDQFWRGGETLSRVKERYKKALDPNWIPPNLRTLAILATHDEKLWETHIPVAEKDRLLKWLRDGCPGWWGKDPSKKWYRNQGWPIPKRMRSSSGPSQSSSGPLWDDWKTKSNGFKIWDATLKRYITKFF